MNYSKNNKWWRRRRNSSNWYGRQNFVFHKEELLQLKGKGRKELIPWKLEQWWRNLETITY